MKVERTMKECKTCKDPHRRDDKYCSECIEKEKNVNKKIYKTDSLTNRFETIDSQETGQTNKYDTPNPQNDVFGK